MKNLLGIIIALGTLTVSCKKESASTTMEGNPEISYQVKVQSNNSPISRVQGGVITITGAKAEASMIKFEAKTGSSELERKSTKRYSIDLLSQSPFAGNVNVPAGTYDEIEFKTFLSPLNGKPSLEVTGNYAQNSTSIPVVFQSSETIELKAEKHNVSIQSGTAYNATTLLNFPLFFSGLTSAELDNAKRTNGSIIINASSNPSLYAKLMEQLRNFHEEELHHR